MNGPARDRPSHPSSPPLATVTPLRIAFVDSWKTATAEGTGTAVGIMNLARGLSRLGHEVVFVGPSRNGTAPPSGGEMSLLYRRLRYNALLPRRIRREGPFDLVVGFDIDGVRWSGSSSRPRPGFILALKGIAADEARFARGRARAQLRFLALLEARSARGAHRVVVPSRYSAEVATRVYGLDPRRIRVVPEALDLAPWQALAADPPPRPQVPTLLSVARQYPRKDTATLIRALPMVRRQVPNLRLRVLGGGPELPRLQALTAELGLSRVVSFEGPLPEDEVVRQAYFQSHVFCLPSRQEGFGIVFLEAMAAGLPIVAVRAAAVPEVVQHGKTGILVPPGSPDALSAALLRVLGDPELRRRMGEEGRKRVGAFGVEKVAERFLAEVGREARDAQGPPWDDVPHDVSPLNGTPEGIEDPEDLQERSAPEGISAAHVP
ncbi:MAG: glycosyltransferase family 1 protein [Gemmatimonadales bacterium]|nr:MAG: glycosyltransferase family 1 protein [Gemmatimonadales bacterium]